MWQRVKANEKRIEAKEVPKNEGVNMGGAMSGLALGNGKRDLEDESDDESQFTIKKSRIEIKEDTEMAEMDLEMEGMMATYASGNRVRERDRDSKGDCTVERRIGEI